MLKDTVGVGVIGTGFGRTVHIPAFLATRGGTLLGVVSRNCDRAREVTAEFSLSRSFASWRDMLECPEIHAVSIATPPASHQEISVAACAAGKAVLCEKPMALDATQAATMLNAACAAGVVHFIGFEFREIPVLRFAKDLIQSGALGRLRHVNVSWVLHSWGDPRRHWSWRSDRAQGGGTLGALGVHIFDYLEWLLGSIKSLTAHLATRIAERPDSSGLMRPVTSEDCCDLLLELHDGTPITLTVSTVAPFGKGHWVELYGEEKSLTIGSANLSDYGKGFAVCEGKPGSAEARELRLPPEYQFECEFSDGRVAPFARLAQRFIDAITKKEVDARPSFDDGLRAQVLMDAAVEAHSARCWIDVSVV